MKRRLSNSEIKELNRKLAESYGAAEIFSKKDNVELMDNIYILSGEAVLFSRDNTLVPTVRLLLRNNFLKKIVVDMGAVKFVAKGADIMRPGITAIDKSIAKGDIVSVVDVQHDKPLAVGKALFSAPEMEGMATGKAIQNLHYVGDKIWTL